LRRLREERHWSKRFVAGKLGCGYSTVCSWEYGTKMPNDEMKVQIAELYEVPITIFFEP
jgi:transcriptional regulator with XRE-family HTH domain